MTTVEVIMTVIALLFVPWMTWVSKQLWVINQHTVGLVERTRNNEHRLDVLEDLLPRHIPRI